MLQPGSQIGRYEIQRRLGRGGMGTVYVAHDPVLGRLVAIKVFATDLDLPDAVQRFTREARSAAALNHPNIVTVHDYGDVESQPFIVMEYVQGDTLADIIRRKAPVALTEKLRWMEELCAGASYAHRGGVLHRDIKPTNLMINRAGQLKILDFGIARMMGTLSPKATALVGTPGYMAPEQILGESLDHRADLFSIGVVGYELLAYSEAFPGETMPTITHRILTQDPLPLRDILPDLHPELIALVDRSLRKNPAERFDDVETLRAAIARVRRQIENESAWDVAAPTVIVPRTAGGISKRGTGSQKQSIPDVAAVAALTPPPETHRVDREALARRRAEQIEECLARARTLLESGDPDAALDACVQALTLEETHAGALELEHQIQAARTTRRTETLLHEAQGELGRQSLTSAQDLLQQARELDPENPELKRLERDLRLARVEATRRQQREQALAAALERAQQALADGETEEALAAARDALALDAQSARAQDLEAEAMRRLDEESAPPTRLHGAGSSPGAAMTPPPFVDDLPPTVLSTRAAVQRGTQSEAAEPAPTIVAPSARRTPQPTIHARPTTPPAATPVPPAPTAERVATPPPPAVAKPPAAPAAKAPVAPPKKALAPPRPRRDYAGEARQFFTRSTASARAAWTARPRKERAIIGWAAAGVVAVVAIGITLLMIPAASTPTGAASIDAIPWATVTRIEAEDGTTQDVPSPAATPLMLTLPAGTYKVTLTGPPPAQESRVVTVQVQPDGTATPEPERFRTITAEEYFEPYLATSSAADGAVGSGATAPGAPGGASTPPAGSTPQGVTQ